MPPTPFTPIPNASAGRDSNADIAILVFAHRPMTKGQWQTMIDGADFESRVSFRTRIWRAMGDMIVSIVHAQPLDLDDREDSDGRSSVLEILIRSPHVALDVDLCRRIRAHPILQTWETEFGADIMFLPVSKYFFYNPHPSKPMRANGAPATPTGLAVFDMDSTLIQQEVIDELARTIGQYSAVAAITEAAMRGDRMYANFAASLRARVALLRGVDSVAVWEQLKAHTITFTPGARELVAVLRARGWKTAVLSGGFTPLAEWVRETLGMDYAFANHLAVDGWTGLLTGELVEGQPIVDGLRKKELLLQLAEENGVPIGRTIAVGDGSNDLPMMHAAGLGVAFNAKPRVQEAAPVKLNRTSLLDVLYVLGFTKAEIVEALGEEDHQERSDDAAAP